MTPVTRIAAVARSHHGVISYAKLRQLGCTEDAIRHLVSTERLWRVHRGVYALEGPLSDYGRALAAVVRCSPVAYSSHLTGAAVLGYRDYWPARPHLTIARRSGAAGPRGIVVHHSPNLAGVGTARGIPVTSPARTVTDCAPVLAAKPLKALVRRAEYDGLDLHTLDRPGIPVNLRRLLERYVIGSGLTANELEARFYEICVGAGLPAPQTQAVMEEERRVDFIWPELRLIVETDGRRGHSGLIAFTDDRVRDRDHTVKGRASLRFTWYEVEREADMVAAQLVAAHAQRRADLGLLLR